MRLPRRRLIPPLLLLAALLQPGGAMAEEAALQRRITLSFGRGTLAEAMRELGTAAGIPVDCNVRSLNRRPVLIYAKDRPLQQVLSSLADILRAGDGQLEWRQISVEGKTRIRLIEDRRHRSAREAALLKARQERVRAMSARLKRVNELHGLATKRRESNAESPDGPLIIYGSKTTGLVHPGSVRPDEAMLQHQLATAESLGYDVLSRLHQQQIQNLQKGGTLSFRFGDLPEEVRRPMMQRHGRTVVQFVRPDLHPGLTFEFRANRDLPDSFLKFRLFGLPERPDVQAVMPLPGIGLSHYGNLLYPGGPADETELPSLIRKALGPLKDARLERRSKLHREAKTNPELARKITVRSRTGLQAPDSNDAAVKERQLQVIEAFEQVARETGMLVVGDFDPLWNDYYSWLDEDRPGERLARAVSTDLTRLPLWEVLETLTDEERLLRWEVSKGRLLLRSPRIQHVMLDRIDLLDDRPPRKPSFPSPDDPKWRHRFVPHVPSGD